MKLTRQQKLLVLSLGHGKTTTPRWRPYVPLEIKGLVEVDKDEAKIWSSMWGVVCATVVLTEKGKAILAELDSDVSLWHATAVKHAATEKKRCLCSLCMAAAWRMRPVAA